MDGPEHRGAPTRVGLVALLGASLLAGACGGVSRLGSGEDAVVSATALGKDGDLEFSISLAKKKFGTGDPISVRMTLRNVGDKPIMVNKRFLVNDRPAPPEDRDVYFTIKMPGGTTAEFAWDLKVGFPEANDFRKLKPGKAVSGKADINDLYFLSETGKYVVKATYQNAHSGPTVYDEGTGDFSVKNMGAARTKRTSGKLGILIGL